MPPETDPNAQSQSGDGQTVDYKAEYIKLSAQIASGEYVPKKVYVGLQQTHENTVISAKQATDALATEKAAREAAENASKSLLTQAEENKAKAEAAALELAKKDALIKRKDLVMEKFPHLVGLEGGGLLPQAPIEDLEGVLTLFSTKLGTMNQAAVKDRLAGASDVPAGKDNTQQPAASQLLNEANAAARVGNFAEYNTKLDLYYAELKKTGT